MWDTVRLSNMFCLFGSRTNSVAEKDFKFLTCDVQMHTAGLYRDAVALLHGVGASTEVPQGRAHPGWAGAGVEQQTAHPDAVGQNTHIGYVLHGVHKRLRQISTRALEFTTDATRP